MNALIEAPGWTPLVTALAHSLWQGAVIAAFLFLALRTVPTRHTNARYALAVGSLLLLVLGWLITWTWLERGLQPVAATPTSIHPPAASPAPPANPPAPTAPASTALAPLAPVPSPVTRPAPPRTPWQPDPRWHARLGIAWLAGMLLFQIRTLVSMGQARALVRDSRVPNDPDLLSCFHRVRTLLGLPVQVRLRICPALSVPAAWGVLKPVLLLPASCLARVSPSELEGILAHELAHIRRHDVLANLLQRALEGLFFFNPFVWWIGRQIRLEREVCCDALAVAATGEPVTYARTLTTLVEQHSPTLLIPPSPMPALGHARHPLVERLRRLLQPHQAPHLHLPRSSLVATLLLGALALVLMKWTTGAVLEALSPAQRIERFAELRKAYPDPNRYFAQEPSEDPAPTTLVQGLVQTADGATLPRATWVHIQSRRFGHTAFSSAHVTADGRFSHAVQSGTLHLAARADGYAPDFAGPFESPAQWTNITLTLGPGFTGVLRLTDPEGRPVPNARVLSRYDHPAGLSQLEHVSDDDGRVTFEHLGNIPLHHQVEAGGFQFDTLLNVSPPAGEPLTWVLHPAAPATGVVVFDDTGEPVPNAEIHLGQRTGTPPLSYGEAGPLNFLSRADADGRFQLRSLRDDATYRLLVSGPGASGIVTGPIGSGDTSLRFELPRAVMLEVTVRNIAPAHLDRMGRLALHAGAYIRYEGTSHGTSKTFHAIPEDGGATLRVGPLWRSPTSLKVADREVNLTWEEARARTEPLIIDLAIEEPAPPPAVEPVLRTLRFAFPDSPGHPAPGGAVLVEYVHDRRMNRILAGITNHQAVAQVPVPTRVELLPNALDGYWFAPQSLQVPAVPEPLDIPLKTFPAGAIHGDVVEEDGQPAASVLVSVIPLEPLPQGTGSSLGVTVRNSTDSGDRQNRFLAGPLPFGGRYVICAYRGATYTVSEPLPINATQPFHEVRLVLPLGIELTGTVLHPDGTPRPRATVEFHFSPTAGHGFSGAKSLTDRAGRFTFPAINPDVRGEYHLLLPSRRDVLPVRQRVVPGEPVEIRLETGLVLEGQVLDHPSGLPLEGAEVFALRQPPTTTSSGVINWTDAEAPTDTEGRFRFSNLAPGAYRILCRSGRLVSPDRIAQAGAGETVTLTIEPYPWHRPQP
ncbi:MAG: carboxypeptidase regulatory-like domain-containing protein [Verrucomicrobiae bacterium]|nr:carboxypeptidase regulatory-like domain-containing protein [Verrucomicrobiae bacterium]